MFYPKLSIMPTSQIYFLRKFSSLQFSTVGIYILQYTSFQYKILNNVLFLNKDVHVGGNFHSTSVGFLKLNVKYISNEYFMSNYSYHDFFIVTHVLFFNLFDQVTEIFNSTFCRFNHVIRESLSDFRALFLFYKFCFTIS